MPIDIFQSPQFITPWTIFLIALIFVVGAIIILTIVERKLNKRISQKKVNEDNIFSRKINLLRTNKSNPELMLTSIDILARDYFEKRYKINKNLKYSSLSEYFKKNNDSSAIRFCEKMQEALYAGEELNPDFVNSLLNNLDFLINSENREKDLIEKNKSDAPQNSFLNIFKGNIDIPSNSVTLQSGISNRHSQTKGSTINGNVYSEIIPRKGKSITEEKTPVISTIPDIKTIKYENIVILTPEEERNVFRIKNYLKEGLDRGFTINLLKQKLLESKFNDKEVNEAVKRIRNEFANKKEPGQNEAPIRVKPIIIPYIKEQIKTKIVNTNNQNAYNNIRSLDNYNRIKDKINQKRVIASDQDSLV